MKTKFINFEGIHGSGKSSSAWFLLKNLQMNHINASVSFEAQMDEPRENLLDFSFVAVLSPTELNELINEFPEHRDSLISLSKKLRTK